MQWTLRECSSNMRLKVILKRLSDSEKLSTSQMIRSAIVPNIHNYVFFSIPLFISPLLSEMLVDVKRGSWQVSIIRTVLICELVC